MEEALNLSSDRILKDEVVTKKLRNKVYTRDKKFLFSIPCIIIQNLQFSSTNAHNYDNCLHLLVKTVKKDITLVDYTAHCNIKTL